MVQVVHPKRSIRYVTISSGGTAVVFGDLTYRKKTSGGAGKFNSEVFCGGLNDAKY